MARHQWQPVDQRPTNQKGRCANCGLIKSRAPNGFRTDWDWKGRCLGTNIPTPPCPPEKTEP